MEKNIEKSDSEMDIVDVDIDFGDETDVEAIKAKAKEVVAEKVGVIKSQNSQLFARLKKAEGFELKDGKWVKSEKSADKVEATPTKTTQTLSHKDTIVLAKADVHEEDIERVIIFAQSEGLTVADALKNDELKAILKIRNEKRASAEASNTQPQRRTTPKVTGDELVAKLKKGEVPERGSKESEDLFWARRGGKR